jgi:hypothetical protein
MKLITIYVTIIKQLHTLSINKGGGMSMSKDFNILENPESHPVFHPVFGHPFTP